MEGKILGKAAYIGRFKRRPGAQRAATTSRNAHQSAPAPINLTEEEES